MLLEKAVKCCTPFAGRSWKSRRLNSHEGWENELVIGVDDTFPLSSGPAAYRRFINATA